VILRYARGVEDDDNVSGLSEKNGSHVTTSTDVPADLR
jgi:hypothetical protein